MAFVRNVFDRHDESLPCLVMWKQTSSGEKDMNGKIRSKEAALAVFRLAHTGSSDQSHLLLQRLAGYFNPLYG